MNKELTIMSNEYKFYFSTKNIMVRKTPEHQARQKNIEYQFMKTSAFHLNLDLPEKYMKLLDATLTK